MKHLIAQSLQIKGQNGSYDIKGPVSFNTLGDVTNAAITVLMPIAGLVLLFVLISGGYDLILSQGAPEKIKTGRAKLTAGFIGFFILAFAYIFVKFLAQLFNLNSGIL